MVTVKDGGCSFLAAIQAG